MATKLQLISDLSEQTARQITDNVEGWKAYLNTAARLYKYSFDDQLLIHAQRPDATACAFMEQWNGKMNRWVKPGSKGIALIHKSSGRPRLEYVFDVSDTRPVRGAKTPWLWEMQEEHRAPVLEKLEKLYGFTGDADFASRLMELAARAVGETYREALHDLEYDIGDSFLEGLDDLNLDVRFRDTLTASVQYTLLTRCGLDASEYLEDDDLQGITEFSTPTVLAHLGNACTGIASGLLVEIGRTIKDFDREILQNPLAKSNVIRYTKDTDNFTTLKHERSNQNERIDIHEKRGLPDSRPLDGWGGRDGGNAAGQVRNAETDLFAGAPQGDVHLDVADEPPVAASAGNQPDSANESEYDADRADEATWRGREAESIRPDEVGAGSKQPESDGGGNSPERVDLPLRANEYDTPPKSDSEKLSDFLSTEPDILLTGILRYDQFLNAKRGDIAAYFEANPGRDERIAYIKNLHNKTYVEVDIEATRVGYRAYEEGLFLWKGAFLSRTSSSLLSWDAVQELTASLMERGEYLSADDKPLPVPKVAKTADTYQLSLFPTVEGQIENIVQAQAEEQSSAFSFAPRPTVSQDVIDRVLTAGSNEWHSMERIVARFQTEHTNSENAAFLQKEYKTGGNGFKIDGREYAVWYDHEGVRIAQGRTVNVSSCTLIPWEMVAAHIVVLLHKGMYATQERIDASRDHERKELANSLWYLRQDFSDEAREQGFMPTINELYGSFPDSTAKIATLLEDVESRKQILSELEQFAEAHQFTHSLMRFHIYTPQALFERLTDLSQTHTLFTAAQDFKPERPSFVTQDEVDRMLTGDGFSENKMRIYSYFVQGHDLKERVSFLKSEYGIGGGGHRGYNQNHDSKGISLRRDDEFSDAKGYDTVLLNWNRVDKRIGELIKAGRYLSAEGMANIPDYEALIIARQVANFYRYDPNREHTGYSWEIDTDEPRRNYVPKLQDPAQAAELLADMQSVLAAVPADFRNLAQMQFATATMESYVGGTYSLFTPLPPEQLQAERDKKEAARAQKKLELEDDDDELDDLAAAARALSRKKPSNTKENTNGQMALDFAATSAAPDEAIEDAPPAEQTHAAAYDLGYGHMGNGLTVWNRLEEVDGDYKTVAHIAADRSVTFYDSDLPQSVREQIEEIAATSEMTISATQDASVFHTPPTQPEPSMPESPTPEPLTPEPTVPQTQATPKRELPTLNADAYLNLKAQHPDKIIGVHVDGMTIYYGTDAETAAPALGKKVVTREVAGLGETTLTGTSNGWQSDLVRLVEKGNSVLFVGDDGSGSYDIIKSRTTAEYIPIGIKLSIEGRSFEIDSVNFTDGTVSLRDLDIPNYPIFRSESIPFVRSFIEEQQFTAENVQQTLEELAPPEQPQQWVEVDGGAISRTVVDLVPELPTLTQKQELHNFHITDDELGIGGPKTKFQYNTTAIRTLKKIEAEKRMATPEEQEVLSHYVGWGALSNAFDPDKPEWAKEYEELKSLLTPEEYDAARSSVLSAYFTSPTVIKSMYQTIQRMGFTQGNVLEPAMGTGNFFGLLPAEMEKSRLYGVEIDSITGRIAKQLYPNANIQNTGYEKSGFPDNFFDLAVGNIPYGSFKVNDKRYNKLNLNIHDYFITKMIDQVRPGGVIALVTSWFTMDKKNSTMRQYLANRAELLGAVRLPNNAFLANAGTGITADILFLQKRDRAIEVKPDWVKLEENADGFTVNKYFADHPEMVLGTLVHEGGLYGDMNDVDCKPFPDSDLTELLANATINIQAKLPVMEPLDLMEQEPETVREIIPADPSVRNFSFAQVNGQLYYRENSLMKPVEMGVTPAARVRGMVGLRDSARRLIDLQLGGAPDAEIDKEQATLNTLYDKFGKQHGLINSLANKQAFEQDSAYPLLCSLEIIDDEGKLEKKADMFTKRTIQRSRAVTSVDTASEALAVSIGEKACVDIGYMGTLMGGSDKIEGIIKDLHGVIFKDPLSDPNDPHVGWQAADEYLSGNVREKLAIAREAAETYPEFAINVERLEQVQPKELTAAEIDVRIGATWIDPKFYAQFMFELLQTPKNLQNDKIDIRYAPITGEWNVRGKSADSRNNARANATYGTKRINAYAIIENALNLRDTRIFDPDTVDGKEVRVLNPKETAIAQQKQEAIGEAFRDWIFKTPERREELCKTYNVIYNSTRPREFDGSHINYVGMNPEIDMRPHQSNAVAHMLYGHNTLLAHCVGAGKTFEMIAAALESKRLGLCQKSLVVVPNHLTEQWGGDFLRLYPGANVLVATKKDFEKQNRKKFCARIATGDYDAVIIGHSQFEKIPLSAARQEAIIQDEISEIVDAIQDAKDNDGERYTIKQMEKSKKNLETRLKKLAADEKKDNVVTFEELGVDRLFVDEAHGFKNLFLHTKMRNVAGIGQSEAQKSSDMFGKCRYMDELTGGRGIVFATGTPVSNSMVELYTMMRYLQYDTLQKQGLGHFDSWAANFGEKVTAIELSPEGTGFRAKTRFAKFFNLPELMNLWKEAADIQTADMLKLPVPEAEYITVTTEPSEHQQAMVADLADRAKDVRDRKVEPNVDNMLRITGDGRKLALDQRLKNELLPDDPDSKVNACVGNVFHVWEESTDVRGAQLIFCDLSTPHYDGTFNVYDDIKNKLIERGVPPEEIKFIHDANTETQKAELFAKVRKGQVRVLIGSTQKMGAGTNVQDRLVASHDLDCPWRPAEDGRTQW